MQNYKNIKLERNKYECLGKRSEVIPFIFACTKCRGDKNLEVYLDSDRCINQVNHCWCRTSESMDDKFDLYLRENNFYSLFIKYGYEFKAFKNVVLDFITYLIRDNGTSVVYMHDSKNRQYFIKYIIERNLPFVFSDPVVEKISIASGLDIKRYIESVQSNIVKRLAEETGEFNEASDVGAVTHDMLERLERSVGEQSIRRGLEVLERNTSTDGSQWVTVNNTNAREMWGEPLNPENRSDVSSQCSNANTHWEELETTASRTRLSLGMRLSNDRMAQIIDTSCLVSPEEAYRFIMQYRDFLRDTRRTYQMYFIEKHIFYGDEPGFSYEIEKAISDEEKSIASKQTSIREWRRENGYTIIERLNDVVLTSNEQEEYDRQQEETDDDEDEDEEYRDECD